MAQIDASTKNDTWRYVTAEDVAIFNKMSHHQTLQQIGKQREDPKMAFCARKLNIAKEDLFNGFMRALGGNTPLYHDHEDFKA